MYLEGIEARTRGPFGSDLESESVSCVEKVFSWGFRFATAGSVSFTVE